MLVLWLHLRGRRCRARSWRRYPDDARTVRCILRRGHDEIGVTAFERMHGAPVGFGWRMWR